MPIYAYVRSRREGIMRKLAATIRSMSSSVGILTKFASHSETTSRMLLLFRGLSISAKGFSAWYVPRMRRNTKRYRIPQYGRGKPP